VEGQAIFGGGGALVLKRKDCAEEKNVEKKEKPKKTWAEEYRARAFEKGVFGTPENPPPKEVRERDTKENHKKADKKIALESEPPADSSILHYSSALGGKGLKEAQRGGGIRGQNPVFQEADRDQGPGGAPISGAFICANLKKGRGKGLPIRCAGEMGKLKAY